MVRKSPYVLLVVAIILFAFLLRSKMLLSGDFYYLLDQARDLLLTKTIAIDHKVTLIGARAGLGGLFHGPLWLYMLTPFFLLAKGNPFFTLVPLFEVVSLVTVLVGFFIGTKLYNFWTGIIFALLLSISATFVETVPFTTNAQVQPIIVLLYLYAIIQFIRGKEKYFAVALFLVGLGFQFESAFAILLIPLTIIAIVIRWKLPTVRYVLLGILGFLFAVSTFILFDLRHHFLMTSSVIHLFGNPVKPLPGYEQYANIGFRVQDRIGSLWSSLTLPLLKTTAFMNYFLLALLAGGIGLVLKDIVRKKIQSEDKEYIFILLSPVIIFGIYILYPLPLWPHYLLPVAAVSCFMLTLTLKKISTFLPGKVVVGLFLLLALFPGILYIKNNYISASQFNTTSDGSYKNQLQAAQWVMDDAGGKEYGYFAYTPGILTYNMDYLLWWLRYKNSMSAPSNTKHTITYLIMAPTQANDLHAHDYWKTNVVRTTGQVLVTKTFPSGITVEKLQIFDGEQPADPNYYQNLLFR